MAHERVGIKKNTRECVGAQDFFLKSRELPEHHWKMGLRASPVVLQSHLSSHKTIILGETTYFFFSSSAPIILPFFGGH